MHRVEVFAVREADLEIAEPEIVCKQPQSVKDGPYITSILLAY